MNIPRIARSNQVEDVLDLWTWTSAWPSGGRVAVRPSRRHADWSTLGPMYQRRTPGSKRDPVKQWALPDRVFFAAGACHMLAYAFLERFPHSGFDPYWIWPQDGHVGHHVVLRRGDEVFDYHGFSRWPGYWAHTSRRAEQRWPGWQDRKAGSYPCSSTEIPCAQALTTGLP